MRARAALVLIAVAGVALGQPVPEVFTSKEGRYSVKFAGKPKEQTQTVKTDLGNLKLTLAVYAAADGKTTWVSYTDYPAEAIKPEVRGKLIEAARDGMAGTDGKVVTDKEIEFGPLKVPGREAVIDRGKFQVRCRYLVLGTRLYQVAVIGPGEYVTKDKDANAFLDSFEVK